MPSGGGVLTSWSHQANADTITTLRLKVYLPTADPSKFTAVGAAVLIRYKPNSVWLVLAGAIVGIARSYGPF